MSWDTFLGGPFNIAEGGLMIHLIAHLTGFTPGRLTIMSGDTHIYENHLHQVEVQLAREPYPAPQLVINDRVPVFADLPHGMLKNSNEADQKFLLEQAAEDAIAWLSKVEPSDFQFAEGSYKHHEPLPAKMAV